MGLGKYFFGGVLFYFIVMTFVSRLQAQGLPSSQLEPGVQKLLDNSWVINNKGTAQLFDLSLTQAYRLQGRVGQDIQAPKSESNKVMRKVRVAILDTGVDVNHPGLFNRIARNSKECARLELYQACLDNNDNTIEQCAQEFLDSSNAKNDADKNKYPMDCTGWSVLADPTPNNILGTPMMSDPNGHGTHVASLVAQVSKNIEIIPVQVLGEKFSPNQPVKPFSIDLSPDETTRNGFDSSGGEIAQIVARGIIYAIHAKADVINLSIGWPQLQDHEILRDAILEAQKQGIIVVAAAGNDSTSALLRPCQYDNVICVAATRPDGSMASFSNFGFGVDVAAPGVSVTGLFPAEHRSISIPGFFGVDILSGTSQASPLVAGLIADMISRGVPKNEIYPRLILGARPFEKELPVLVGPVNKPGVPVLAPAPYEKTVLGGQVDGIKSLAVPAQTLILNATKTTEQIIWNRQNAVLPVSFKLKNYWKATSGAVEVRLAFTNKNSVLPAISQLQFQGSSSNQTSGWKEGEIKTLNVKLNIQDAKVPGLSRIPRELNFEAVVLINGQVHRRFPLRAEIITKLDLNLLAKDSEVQSLPLSRGRQQGEKYFLIDEIYDTAPNQRDYFLISKGEKDFSLALARMTKAGYEITQPVKFKINGNILPTKPLHRIRIDVDQDGQSEYVFTLQEFETIDGVLTGSSNYRLHVFILNQDLSIKKYFKFYDDRTLFPLEFTWLKVGSELRPAWVAQGFKVIPGAAKDELEGEDIYMYHLDKNYELAQIATTPGLRIVDLIQPSVDQIRKGQVPVLVAKNLGTPNKPSFLNEFYFAWIVDQKPTNLQKLEDVSASLNGNYRNLIDTRKDRSLNLSFEESEFKGNFWFGGDAHQKQRISMIDFNSMKFVDQLLSSEQQVFDAPLRVRSAYSGGGKQATFVMTNTEIEYHDLTLKQKAMTSLNKYTFIGDDLIVDLQFPVTLTSSVSAQSKTPALFTTEGSGLSSSLRILTADYDKQGKLIGLISPARLSLQSPEGCKPLDFPMYINQEYAIDYDCGNRFIRIKLKY